MVRVESLGVGEADFRWKGDGLRLKTSYKRIQKTKAAINPEVTCLRYIGLIREWKWEQRLFQKAETLNVTVYLYLKYLNVMKHFCQLTTGFVFIETRQVSADYKKFKAIKIINKKTTYVWEFLKNRRKHRCLRDTKFKRNILFKTKEFCSKVFWSTYTKSFSIKFEGSALLIIISCSRNYQ